VLGPALSDLIGGSADLTGSNLTDFKDCGALRIDANGLKPGRHINYGVREFGMAAIMNGMALHTGFIPYGGTFLTFSDYSRNALRMAALMRQRVIHVFTHDSIGLGEDGPTHQPIEHAASLRLIPNLDVWRPADAIETAIAWTSAIHRQQGPSALLLTRQAVPILEPSPRSGSPPHEVPMFVGITSKRLPASWLAGRNLALRLKPLSFWPMHRLQFAWSRCRLQVSSIGRIWPGRSRC